MSAKQPAAQLARELDPTKQPQILLSLNVRQVEIINRPYQTGLHGNSPQQVAMRMLDESLIRHEAEFQEEAPQA